MAAEELVRLNYASTATFEPSVQGGVEVEVARILKQSRRNNRELAVGGVLHYGNGYFFQCLEGERDAVQKLYERISRDPRHRDVKTLTFSPVGERLFGDWSMKYLPIERDLRGLLERYRLEFNPYQFTEAFIQEFLEACVVGVDPTMAAHAHERGTQRRAQRPLWKRLLGLG
ncbi:BLUF domain-containing protein [Spiribacter halobius]|uniref:Blue light sensor protein n=1 Tax=Sediminicurvatus halobius TaxID=2182432 RepID=A0A2U2N185_9GAMM|nr:BLUF domain-containing protein [Spiribacter halobius]PWG62807.1 blue light sensor protein [Spiribacter halobius]UEX77046.1 BLUF domain-containing protein [Spiribacter halobius]